METMSSARACGGKHPEGRGNVHTDNKRGDVGNSECITPTCHFLPIVPSHRVQLIPEKSLL